MIVYECQESSIIGGGEKRWHASGDMLKRNWFIKKTMLRDYLGGVI